MRRPGTSSTMDTDRFLCILQRAVAPEDAPLSEEATDTHSDAEEKAAGVRIKAYLDAALFGGAGGLTQYAESPDNPQSHRARAVERLAAKHRIPQAREALARIAQEQGPVGEAARFALADWPELQADETSQPERQLPPATPVRRRIRAVLENISVALTPPRLSYGFGDRERDIRLYDNRTGIRARILVNAEDQPDGRRAGHVIAYLTAKADTREATVRLVGMKGVEEREVQLAQQLGSARGWVSFGPYQALATHLGDITGLEVEVSVPESQEE